MMDAPGDELVRHVRGLAQVYSVVAGSGSRVLRLSDLCEAAITELGLRSATISTVTSLGPIMVANGGGSLGPALVDLQVSHGEGPTFDVVTQRRPVMVNDLEVEGRRQWVEFTASAVGLGCSALWCLPLGVGAARFGVLEMSFPGPQVTVAERTRMALAFAKVATETMLDLEAGRTAKVSDADASRVVGLRAEVCHAQGMVKVDLGSDLNHALARMRAHAFAHGLDLVDLAQQIVSGTVHFDEQ